MPAYVSIERVALFLDEVESDEDADYASLAVAQLSSEDSHTSTTLGEALEQLVAAIPGLRLAALFRDEEGRIYGMTGDGAVGAPGPIRRMIDAAAPGARPAKRQCPEGYATVRAAVDLAAQVIEARDTFGALDWLDDTPIFAAKDVRFHAFVQRKLDDARSRVWQWLALRKKTALSFERVLRGFETERQDVANAIAYVLWKTPAFAEPLFHASTSENQLVRERCLHAIAEWPDFPFAAKSAQVTSAEPDIAPAKKVYDAAAIIEDIRSNLLPTLEDDSPKSFRKVMRAITRHDRDDLRDAVLRGTADAIVEQLGVGRQLRRRAFGLELLIALGVPRRELGSFIEGLPRTGGIREIELAADPATLGALPEITLIVRKDDVPWPGDKDVERCELTLVGDRLVAAKPDGKERWSDATLCAGLERSNVSWHAKGERICVLVAEKKIVLLDRATGQRVLELDTPARKAVLPHERGFLVWDGRNVLGDPVESGLIVMPNGETHDVVGSVLLARVVRECGDDTSFDISCRDVIRNGKERFRFAGSIWEVGPAGAKLVPIRQVAGGAVNELAANAKAVKFDVPERKQHQSIVDGIDFNLAAVESAEDKAMLRAEIAQTGDQVADLLHWHGDLAASFPRAKIRIATPDSNEEKVAKDKRGKANMPKDAELPESYRRYAAARTAWQKAWAEGMDGAELMGLLGDPAFSPSTPSSLKKLANRERIRMYELVRRSTPEDVVPVNAILAAIEREVDDVYWRVAGDWSFHERAQEVLTAAYLNLESPVLKHRVARAIGHRANERADVLKSALEAKAKKEATAAAAGSMSEQVDFALSAEKQKKKYAASVVKEAVAASEEAIKNRALSGLLRALEKEGMWADTKSADEARRYVWSEIVRIQREDLSFKRILRALAEERDQTANRITYKLYVQRHQADNVAAAVKDIETRSPPKSALLLKRLKEAIAEWPDWQKE